VHWADDHQVGTSCLAKHGHDVTRSTHTQDAVWKRRERGFVHVTAQTGQEHRPPLRHSSGSDLRRERAAAGDDA